MTTAEKIHKIIREYYLDGTPEGRDLADVADEIHKRERKRARVALAALLDHLEETAALSCLADDLAAAIDDVFKEHYPKEKR